MLCTKLLCLIFNNCTSPSKLCDKNLKLFFLSFNKQRFKFLFIVIFLIFLNSGISSSVITFPFFAIKLLNK